MARYNYYTSPRNSARAIAFRQAYGNAPMGQNFMFEGQPYAKPGPPGLLAEEGPGTATGYKPIVRINPNDRAYMPPEMLVAIAEKEANRKRLGPRIGGRTKVLREGPHITPSGYVDPTKTSLRWVDPEGSFAQSPHGLETLEQQIQRDKLNQTPSYLTSHRNSAQYQPGFQNIISGNRSGQDTGPPQGLLSKFNQMAPSEVNQMRPQHRPTDDMSGPRWTDRWKKEKGDLHEPNTDKSGWMRDERMSDSQNRNLGMANLLINFGKQQSSDDGWGGPLTHY